MAKQDQSTMIDITDAPDIWSRCFMVHSLVIIGSREANSAYNLAPKHMAMPLGFGNYFGFMGTPRKKTYENVKREKAFTVSYPQPHQLVLSSLSASRREKDDTKPIIEKIPTVDARRIDGKFLKDSYFQLECELSQTVGKFGEWELVVGEIVAAYVHKNAHRDEAKDKEDSKLIENHPLLAYLHPDRFSIVKESHNFPLPKDFKR
jgi:flavin reductase (DIM6/NTAB) family NADH-FMN oxidoreductase RutF